MADEERNRQRSGEQPPAHAEQGEAHLNDIRLTQLSNYIESEAKKLGFSLFLNRNDAWGRDYGSQNDSRAEVKMDRTFGGERGIKTMQATKEIRA